MRGLRLTLIAKNELTTKSSSHFRSRPKSKVMTPACQSKAALVRDEQDRSARYEPGVLLDETPDEIFLDRAYFVSAESVLCAILCLKIDRPTRWSHIVVD
jgi:hypothetical protein